MLGMLKYDLKATCKKTLFLLGLVFICAVLSKFFWSDTFFNMFDSNNFYIATIFKFASLGLYGCMAFVALFSAMVTMSGRYGKNMFGNEGYFVNAIPLNGWIKVGSKTITAIVWNAVLVFGIALSIVLFVAGNEQVLAILAVFDEFADSGAGNLHIGWVIITSCIFFTCNGVLWTVLLYASISLGQLVDDIRNIVIFFGFLALGLAVLIVTMLLAFLLGVFRLGELGNMEAIFGLIQAVMLKMSFICAVISGVLYALNAYLVESKLNLE